MGCLLHAPRPGIGPDEIKPTTYQQGHGQGVEEAILMLSTFPGRLDSARSMRMNLPWVPRGLALVPRALHMLTVNTASCCW